MGKVVPGPVEQYLASLNRLGDEVLDDIARAGRQAEVPCVDAEVGALLRVLATAIGARHVLEIGCGIGYSAIWLARASPDGRCSHPSQKGPGTDNGWWAIRRKSGSTAGWSGRHSGSGR